jgi:RNA polymerase sigma-70 factor (ECF subfamily)
MSQTLTQHPDHHLAARLAELQARLRAFALSLTGNGPDADEVLQDTNQILLRKWESFAAGTSLQAWAFQTAAFEARNFLRRKARNRQTEVPSEELLARLSTEAQHHQSDRAYEQRRAALPRCLDKLAPRDRDLLNHRYQENSALATLAAERGCTQNALAQKLFRLRAAVLKCMQKQLKQLEKEGGHVETE